MTIKGSIRGFQFHPVDHLLCFKAFGGLLYSRDTMHRPSFIQLIPLPYTANFSRFQTRVFPCLRSTSSINAVTLKRVCFLRVEMFIWGIALAAKELYIITRTYAAQPSRRPKHVAAPWGQKKPLKMSWDVSPPFQCSKDHYVVGLTNPLAAWFGVLYRV